VKRVSFVQQTVHPQLEGKMGQVSPATFRQHHELRLTRPLRQLCEYHARVTRHRLYVDHHDVGTPLAKIFRLAAGGHGLRQFPFTKPSAEQVRQQRVTGNKGKSFGHAG
jgi:hypothetical protein